MSDFFKNTFGKDDSEHNLQYDDTAFLFFIMSISVTFSIVLFFLIIRQIRSGGEARREYNLTAKDPLFKEKRNNLSSKIPSVYLSFSFLFKVILLIVLISVSSQSYSQASSQSTTLKGFDPYELLGVDFNTPIGQIKKAYRKLALDLHPDRNPNNPQAASKFIFVSKAYECLTDETKRQKCLKYGNPDGSESFNVGIALPSFLVVPGNQIYVMFVIFAILLFVIPKLFLMWNNRFQTRDGRGIMVENYYLLFRMFINGISPEEVMKAASQMKEVQNIVHPQLKGTAGKSFVKEFEKHLENQGAQEGGHNHQNCSHDHQHDHENDHQHQHEHNHQHKHEHEHEHQHEHGQQCNHSHQHQQNSQRKGHEHSGGGCCDHDHDDDQQQQQRPILTAADYNRWKKSLKPVPLTEVAAQNLIVVGNYIQRQVMYHKLLEQMPNLLRSMIYFSLDFCTKSSKKKKSLFPDDPNLFYPYMGTKPYHFLLSVSKNYYQNAEGSSQGLQNLTLTHQQIVNLSKEYSIRRLTIDQAAKNKFLQNFKEPARKEQLKRQIELMPAIKIETSTFAGDAPETTFTERDTVTFKFKITKNPTHGVAFLPSFGYLKRQKYYFSLQVQQQLLYFQEVIFEPGQTQLNIEYSSYRSRDICEQQFLALLRSDCYFGLDVGKNIPLKFVEYTGTEKIIYNKEDLHVQRIPKTYFEEALTIEMTDPLENQLSDTADDDNGDAQDIPEQNVNSQQQKAPAMSKIQ